MAFKMLHTACALAVWMGCSATALAAATPQPGHHVVAPIAPTAIRQVAITYKQLRQPTSKLAGARIIVGVSLVVHNPAGISPAAMTQALTSYSVAQQGADDTTPFTLPGSKVYFEVHQDHDDLLVDVTSDGQDRGAALVERIMAYTRPQS